MYTKMKLALVFVVVVVFGLGQTDAFGWSGNLDDLLDDLLDSDYSSEYLYAVHKMGIKRDVPVCVELELGKLFAGSSSEEKGYIKVNATAFEEMTKLIMNLNAEAERCRNGTDKKKL